MQKTIKYVRMSFKFAKKCKKHTFAPQLQKAKQLVIRIIFNQKSGLLSIYIYILFFISHIKLMKTLFINRLHLYFLNFVNFHLTGFYFLDMINVTLNVKICIMLIKEMCRGLSHLYYHSIERYKASNWLNLKIS